MSLSPRGLQLQRLLLLAAWTMPSGTGAVAGVCTAAAGAGVAAGNPPFGFFGILYGLAGAGAGDVGLRQGTDRCVVDGAVVVLCNERIEHLDRQGGLRMLDPGLPVLLAPTATTDRECSVLTVCGAGEEETVPPTATTDRVCEAKGGIGVIVGASAGGVVLLGGVYLALRTPSRYTRLPRQDLQSV